MSKELEKTQNASLATPTNLIGMEDFGDVDSSKAIPRLQICQAMSDTAKEAGVPEGHWYNNYELADLGDSLEFVVLKRFQSRVYLKQGEGLVCRSDDAKLCSYTVLEGVQVGLACSECQYSKWDEASKLPPPCSLAINYLVLLRDNPIPAVISCMKTAMPAARKFDKVLQMSLFRYGSISGGLFAVKTVKQKSDKGTFYVPEFIPKGQAPQNLAKMALTMRNSFSKVVVHDEKEKKEEF